MSAASGRHHNNRLRKNPVKVKVKQGQGWRMAQPFPICTRARCPISSGGDPRRRTIDTTKEHLAWLEPSNQPARVRLKLPLVNQKSRDKRGLAPQHCFV